MNEVTLLPINTRVTHFDGSPSTHGKGTIIAYNGIQPNNYFQEKPKEAAELAAKAGLLDALVNSAYDGVRCPYVVRWDYRQEFFDRHPHLKERHPHGYTDVYEPSSIQVIPLQIFKKGGKLKAVRVLDENDELCEGNLTWGEIVTMVDHTSEGREFIIIRRENGRELQLETNRFELVE